MDSIRATLAYLSGDEMEGRGMGTAGLDKSARFIASYFAMAGLEPPPGAGGYMQDFKLKTIAGAAPETYLKVDGEKVDTGAFSPLAYSAEKGFSGQVVFAGYGVTADERNASGRAYDDFAGVDVRGKVVLVMRFEPHQPDGRSRLSQRGWSDHAGLITKARNAASRGAVAVLIVHPPSFHLRESMTALARRVTDQMPIPVIQVRQSVAEAMLKQAGAKDLRQLQAEIDKDFSPRPTALSGVRAEGNIKLEYTYHALKNVMAYLPGKGRHSDEVIVLGAHYDHLGRGGFGSLKPGANEVHNGADDNASGTATVLELARLFAAAGPQERSLLFVAFSAEEEGLIGSAHFVNDPPVAMTRIVAMLNFDMVGRLRNNALTIGGEDTSPLFSDLLKRADETSPIEIRSTWKNGMAPSDSTSFVVRRVPSLFFFTGVHEDYHKPTDDADKINYEGQTQITDMAARMIKELAAAERIGFNSDAAVTRPATRPAQGGGASPGEPRDRR